MRGVALLSDRYATYPKNAVTARTANTSCISRSTLCLKRLCRSMSQAAQPASPSTALAKSCKLNHASVKSRVEYNIINNKLRPAIAPAVGRLTAMKMNVTAAIQTSMHGNDTPRANRIRLFKRLSNDDGGFGLTTEASSNATSRFEKKVNNSGYPKNGTAAMKVNQTTMLKSFSG